MFMKALSMGTFAIAISCLNSLTLSSANANTVLAAPSKKIITKVNFAGVYDLIDSSPLNTLCAASLVIKTQCGGYKVYTNLNTVEEFCAIEEETRNPPFPDRNPPFPDNNPPFPDNNPPFPDDSKPITIIGGKSVRVTQSGNILTAKNKNSMQTRVMILNKDILYKQNGSKNCIYKKR